MSQKMVRPLLISFILLSVVLMLEPTGQAATNYDSYVYVPLIAKKFPQPGWINKILYSGYDNVEAAVGTRDGGLVMVGSVGSEPGITESYGLILKLDVAGAIQWQRAFNNLIRIHKVAEDEDGNVVVGARYTYANPATVIKYQPNGDVSWAWSSSTLSIDDWIEVDNGAFVTANGLKLWRLNSDGSTAWAKQYHYSPSGGIPTSDLAKGNDGGNVVATRKVLTNEGLVFKINDEGSVTWAKKYGNKFTGLALAEIHSDGSDGYIVSGYQQIPETSPVILKIDNLGNLVWSKVIQVDALVSGLDLLQITADGGLLFSGFVTLQVGDARLWLVKMSATGEVVWAKSYHRPTYLSTVELSSIGDLFIIASEDKDIVVQRTNVLSHVDRCPWEYLGAIAATATDYLIDVSNDSLFSTDLGPGIVPFDGDEVDVELVLKGICPGHNVEDGCP